MYMQVILIYNPASGSSLPLNELLDHFENASIEVVATIDITKYPEQKLKPYLKKRGMTIAAYGGDGTLSSAASLIIGSNVNFAPLPGGTLNHFTKDLGVPQDLDEALSNLKKAKPRPIDVASINGQIFLNNSGIGLYPLMLYVRDDLQTKRISKWFAAMISGIRVFIRYRRYSVVIGGNTFKTPFVFVGNNDYGLEHQLIGERKKLNEGILSVYAVSSAKRRDFLKTLGSILLGKHPSRQHLKLWKTESITITTKRQRIRVSRDGEHELLATPLEYRIISKGLNVLY